MAGWCFEHTEKVKETKIWHGTIKMETICHMGTTYWVSSERKVPGLKNKRLKDRLFTVTAGKEGKKKNQGIKCLHYLLYLLITQMSKNCKASSPQISQLSCNFSFAPVTGKRVIIAVTQHIVNTHRGEQDT